MIRRLVLLCTVFVCSACSHSQHEQTLHVDVLVYGASLGGTTAALQTARHGISTLLVSETNSIGGQAVNAGLSSFDESRYEWENYGSYWELKQYLRTKYPSETEKTFGLGNAQVGSLSTIPSDIEEFFVRKTESLSPTIQIVKNYSIEHIEPNQDGQYSSIILRNTREPFNTLRVEFLYALDGTETGNLFERAGIATKHGLDIREETNEESALSFRARKLFVDGSDHSPAFGNRLQPIGSPFALFDRGYTGRFIEPEEPSKECWGQSDNADMRHASTFTARKDTCTLSFSLRSVFPDTYDIYLLLQSGSTVKAEIRSPDFSHPLYVHLQQNDEEKVHVATLHLSKKPTSLSVSAMHAGQEIRGALLQKRNIHISSASVAAGKQTLSFASFPYLDSTVYAVSHSNAREIPFRINKRKYTAQPIGNNTFVAHNVVLDSEKSTVESAFDLLVVPHSPYYATKDLAQTQSGAWTMSADKNESYLLFADNWTPRTWGEIEVTNPAKENKQIMVFNGKHQVRDMGLPIGTVHMQEGDRVDLSLTDKEQHHASLYSIALSSSPIVVSHSNMKHALHVQDKTTGLYDIWIEGNGGQTAKILYNDTAKEILLPETSMSFAGRYFISPQHPLHIDTPKRSSIYAIATMHADTYRSSNRDTDDFCVLPSGYWTVVEQGNKRILPLDGTGERCTVDTNSTAPVTVFEALPTQTIRSFPSLFPLLHSHDSNEKLWKQQTFFGYRNIVSGNNLFRSAVSLPIEKYIHKRSLGLSLILTPANDYGPITIDNILSVDTRNASRRLSYGYYYWLKYLMPFMHDTHCSSHLSCDSRRVQLALGIIDSKEAFAPRPYLRDGRRLVAKDRVTESDLLLSYRDCSKQECSPLECHAYQQGTSHCIDQVQEAVFPEDAVVAMHYPIDIHSLFTHEEIEQGTRKKFLKTIAQDNPLPLFEHAKKTKPISIPMGALLPRDEQNIFPASINFGTTHIANSALRVHTSEIALGEAIGRIVAYSMLHSKSPFALYQSPEDRKQLQRWMIEDGMMIFPLHRVSSDNTERMKQKQLLLLDGDLPITPTLVGERLHYMHTE